MKSTILCLLALSASGAAAAQPVPGPMMVRMAEPPAPPRTGDSTRLAMTLVEGLPTISATINGKGPFRLGVDTGSRGYLRVTPAVAQALGLKQVGEALAVDPSGKDPVRIPVYRTDRLTLGSMSFEQVPTATFTLTRSGVDGIIGASFFRDLLLTLDYGRLSFSAAKGSLPPADGKNIVDVDLDVGAIPTLPLTIGGWSTRAHLDSGNTRFALFVPADQLSSMPTKGQAHAIGTGHTVTQTIDLQAVDLAAPVLVGQTRLPVASVGFPAAGPIANLGSLALTGMQVTVDEANHRVRIVPSAPAGSARKPD
jgi:Aspartyl protease